MDCKLLSLLIVAALVVVVNSVAVNEGSDTGSASGSGSGSAAGEASADTSGKNEQSTQTETTVAATEAGTSAAGTANAGADVSLKAPGPTTAFKVPELPDESGDNKDTGNKKKRKRKRKPKTPKPTTTPATQPPTTTPPPSPSPPSKCPGMCDQPDFNGFGSEPGKCGCCPWPCCCKCVEISGDSGPCSAKLDLSIIMDASGSISIGEWVVAKQFVNDMLHKLDNIGQGQHVALTTFSSKATNHWGLKDVETSSADNLRVAIEALERKAELTNTVAALELSVNEIFVPPFDDPEAKNVAILFTDGKANYRVKELPQISDELRAKAETICVGVTNRVSRDELRLTCDEDRIFSVNQFSELTSLISNLQTMICPEPTVDEKCFCCCTPEQYYGMPHRFHF